MADVKEKVKKSILYLLSDRVLAFLGVFFVSSCLFVALLFSANLRIGIVPEIFAFAGLMVLGYLLQSLWCKLIRFERIERSISYEALEKSYRISRALPILILAVIAGLAIAPSVDKYLQHLSQTAVFPDVYYYDEDSFIPYLASIFVAAGIAAGSFAWFFHAERILTGRAAVVCLIFLAVSIFFSMNIGAGAVIYQSVCVVGFTCCWMFAMNRQALERTLASDKAPHPGANVTWYNTAITFVLLVAVLVLLGLFYVVISGIKTLFSFILATILASGEGQDGWSRDPELISAQVNAGVFGTPDASKSPQYWFMIVTIFILVAALILYLSRRTHTVQQLVAAFFAFLKSVIAALLGPMQDFFSKEMTVSDEFTFLDEEEKLSQRAVIRSGDVRVARTWFDFLGEYRAKKTPEDRYRFAYAEYAAILRRNHGTLKTSDTPRETGKKLRGLTDNEETRREIDAYTGAFERTDFACLPADASTEEATKILLREIKHYLK